ncbi:hypothetical protein CYLTODRAFT_491663 [Cylindrobasidium torrendii FP15055 ss-10]|uniref:Protein transport protein SEC31 n=1 Tax=Cylindrobasidium torrendii FP15055 ss-10 TaxID=1314674 RepID=A0A0D7B6T8_9AGAR|nr:hypothetical protein CYLTODRAFT_491663 [Cylindrobasidium torrendii FP15055 ss-10]
MLTTIPRTAAFSWGPGRQLVTGSEGALEIWDLLDFESKSSNASTTTKKSKKPAEKSGAAFFDEPAVGEEQEDDETPAEEDAEVDDEGEGPKPRGLVRETGRFLNVAWGAANVIAAGMEGGELKLWDSSKILSGEDALLATHQRPVRNLQFGPIQSHLLATGGGPGEVYIWDVNTPDGAPYAPTNGKADAEGVKWNRVVAHVLGGVGSSGAVVWDLRGKREVVRLPGGRMSDLEWCPDNATKVATACEDDATPVVQLWDLRHARAPEQVYSHHTLGVRSLSWNAHDSTFLLSSGKEGRAVCFNATSGETLGEVIGQGVVSWSPSQPGLAAFAGDSAVRILPPQNLEREKEDIGGGEDFFDVASSEGEGLGLTQAGKWMGSHGGASWGFGGRLVSFAPEGKSVKIRHVVWEGEKVERAQRLVDAIKKGDGEGGLKDLGILSELFEGDVKTRVAKLLGNDQDETEVEEEEKAAEDDDFFSSTHTDSTPYTIDTTDPVSRALTKGDIARAVKACVKEGRWTEALLLARKGSSELLDETEKLYFSREAGTLSSSESLVRSVVRGDIGDVVRRGEGWRDVLSIVSRFAAPTEPKEETFPVLVEQMGERWSEEQLWVLGGRLDKLVDVWGAGDDGLEGLMERVAVFRGATGFVDPDLPRQASASTEDEELPKWKFAKLYDKYLEYVDVLVGQGKEDDARIFLEFVPAAYEGSKAIRERLGVRSVPANVAASTASARTTVKSGYAPSTTTTAPAYGNAGASLSSLASQPAPPATFGGYPNPYQNGHAAAGFAAPTAPTTGPYAPAAPPTGPYAPPPHAVSTSMPPPGPYNASSSVAPPAMRTAPPPPPKRDNQGWNDAPVLKNTPAPPRKSGTPAPITSPFANQSPYDRPSSRGLMGSPPPPPMRGVTSPPPPPPQGGPSRPGSTIQPPMGGRLTPTQRPPGPYAPPPVSSRPPSGPSFSGMPPPQQGAFTAGGHFAAPVPPPGQGFAPPPGGGRGFSVPTAGPQFIDSGLPAGGPPNPYGPPPPGQSGFAPPSQAGFAPPGQPGFSPTAQPGPYGPPTVQSGFGGPPPPPSAAGIVPPPPGGPSGGARVAPPPKAKEEKKPEPPKYPSGDRSHIPDRLRTAFEVFESELRRTGGAQQRDLEKRLTPLFDAMNCETLKSSTEDGLRVMSQAMAAHDRPAALALHVEMLTRGDGDVSWMTALKQLIVRL